MRQPWAVVLVALMSLLVVLSGGEARAEGGPDFAAAVRDLAKPSNDDVIHAIQAVAASGQARARDVLAAMRDGNLAIGDDGAVFVREANGALRDAATGDPVPPRPTHDPSMDNETRRVLEPLAARLDLVAPDPKVRIAAVEALGSSGDEADGEPLRAALANEKDTAVRRAMTVALAELDLASANGDRRLGAVTAMAGSGSLKFRTQLEGVQNDPDARVAAAAKSALTSLARKRFILDRTADVIYGMSTGSVLLLSALGLAITFGLMRVINMAHGEMLMLGAYATFVTQGFFHAHLPDHESLYLIAAVPIALVTCMLAGALLEVTVVRFLYGRPLETLLATYGLSLLLIQIVRSTFGAQNVAVENPAWLSGGTEIFEDVVIPYNRIAVVLFTIVVVSFVGYMLRGTSLGLLVRAVTQNRPMAAAMGISTRRVDTWTFALGSGVGGLGGVALAQLGNVGPELGQSYIVDSFMVVVLGGVGKLVGCVVAAFGLGILNKLLEPVAGAVLGKIAILLLVVVIIQRRPQGLFAPRGRGLEGT
jgi:urea transport system permease protein